jgi:hypothetical protein
MHNLLNVISGSIGSFIRQSNEQEAATARLAKALESQGIFTASLLNDLQQYANMRQELTGIDNTATLAIMAQLSAMGFQGEELKRLTDLSQDLSVVMETDLKTAARLVGRAIQDGGEELKRYGFTLDKIAGQAVAFGQTSAGAMKRNEQAIGDLQKSFGQLLSTSLQPFVDLGTRLVNMLTDMPPAAQAAALGVGILAASWALFNSQLGITQIMLGATVGILLTVYTAFKSGEGYLYALAGVLGIVATAFTMLHGQMLLSTVAAGQFRFALQLARVAAVEFFTALGPLGWVIVGLGAIAAAWGMIQRETKNAEEAARQYQEQIKQLSDAKLTIDIADATLAIADLAVRVQQLKKESKEGRIHVSPELLGFELQLQLQRERLKLLESERVRREQINELQRKQAQEAASPKVQLDVAELRAKAMADGVAKELALLDIRHQRELQQIEERKNRESLSVDQVNALKNASEALYVAERTRIIQEGYEKEREEREKSTAEYYEYTQFLKKLDEELALDTAQTDEEKYHLKRSFLEKEIADLEALGPRMLEQEKRLAEARTELKKLNNAEAVRLERERQDLEQQMRELRTGDIAEDNRREIEAIRLKYNALRALAIKHGKDVADINRAQQAEELAAIRRHAEESRRLWAEQNELPMIGINSIGAGYQALWSNIIVGHRQAKDEGDAIWLAMRNTALNALGAILVRQIENLFITIAMRKTDVASHAAAETAKTAITQENAIVRVASAVWEGARKAAAWAWEGAKFIAGEIWKTTVALAQGTVRVAAVIAETAVKVSYWVAEQAAFIAKEIAMTAVFLAQKAIRVAAALAEVAASIAKAVAEFIASLGPFGLFAAAGAIALGLTVLGAIKKAFGFARGGIFEKNQRGFIEGGQEEIITPKRTAVDVLRQDLIPAVVEQLDLTAILRPVLTTQSLRLQVQPAFAEYDFKRLEKRLDTLDRTIRKKEWSPVFQNFRDEERIVRTTLPGAQWRLERRRR